MGKKPRRPSGVAVSTSLPEGAEIPVVGGREPCPCGSGKRYKACHGRAALVEAARLVTRPFEGLPGECDWVAMREIVPAATATVRLGGSAAGDHAGTEVTVVTVLPMAWPAMRRADGAVFLGLQTTGAPADPSLHAAAALIAALAADPGTPVPDPAVSASGPRLQDLVPADGTFPVSVHEGFDFWLDAAQDVTPEVRDSLERANGAVIPTRRLTSVDGAYWCRIGDRRHLRWVLPHSEAAIVDGIARLHAAGASGLGAGTRYVGSFRADGLLAPVWDLTPDAEVDDVEAPAKEFEQRLVEAMADSSPLTAQERRARNGVASRQLTLR
jgi:Family of unknown function (DUF5926)/SEC-C motif